MIQNLHTHATFCDGKNSPEELVHEAIRMDMDALGFSSHAPLAGQEDWTMSPEDVPRYRAEILRLRKQYVGRLEIFLGLEQDYYSPPPGEGWDYLIGSVHCVEKGGRLLSVDSLPEDFVRSARQYYGGDFYAFAQDYYRLVGDVAEKTGCQIVGHFDLIAKFNEGDRLFDTSHPRYANAALEALANVFHDMLELAEVEKTMQLLAEDIEKTRRRVNALEYVMIPEFQQNIRYISMKLEENERGNITRLMKVKDMVLQEAHDFQQPVG